MDKKRYTTLMEDLRHRAEGLSMNKQSPMSAEKLNPDEWREMQRHPEN